MSYTAKSADGQGRTLLDIILWRNAKPMGPVEFQYHNPFGIRVGNSVTVEHDMNLSGINFFVDGILVYETQMDDGRKFYDTEYSLRGQALGMPKPKFARLRVAPDDESIDPKFPFKLQVLERYDELQWDQEFWDYLHDLPDGVFQVNQDDDGKSLPEGEERKYWRVDDAVDPYNCAITVMKDKDRNGTVEDDELEYKSSKFWDFSRETNADNGEKYIEYLNVEMDNDKKHFSLYRGKAVMPFQVKVV